MSAPRRGTSATSTRTLPNFLIIGAAKSGTTALAEYLRAHPEVFISRDKELHFFDERYDEGLRWYEYQFRESDGYKAVGEATPSYMYDPNAIERIATVLPRVRLIAILRDPVDRAYSHYWHHVRQGHEERSFPDAIRAELGSRADKGTAPAWSYLDRGQYLEQLSRVCERYPRAALHVVVFEEMLRSPEQAFGGVCRFLEIDSSVVPATLGKVVNPYVEYRSQWVREHIRRWPKRIRNAVGRLNIRRTGYEPMDPQAAADLATYFRPQNEALAAWLGRDLSMWQA